MPLDQEELDMSKGQCVFHSSSPCDEDTFDLCMILMEELGLQFPSNSPLEATDTDLTLSNINIQLSDDWIFFVVLAYELYLSHLCVISSK